MSKKSNVSNDLEPTIVNTQKYSKSAFVDAAESNKDRLILQVVLADEKIYTREEVNQIVQTWKQKEVK